MGSERDVNSEISSNQLLGKFCVTAKLIAPLHRALEFAGGVCCAFPYRPEKHSVGVMVLTRVCSANAQQ
jgi:hypothetical protein